jgi:uncharacterized Zn-binding protein involved in type VI secretion
MPPAARTFDFTSHPGFIKGPGAPKVLINGLPAARISDDHICLLPPLAGPHPPGKIISGSGSVLIGGFPAARTSDWTNCGAQIITGSLNVLIGD